MDWRNRISKLWGRMTKEKWIALLAIGAILMILAVPLPGGEKTGGKADESGQTVSGGFYQGEGSDQDAGSGETGGEAGSGAREGAGAGITASGNSYEAALEERIEGILQSVDGVGTVDVMVVLKSSGEKVLRVDRTSSSDTTKETDSAGGTREASVSQWEENTVLTGQGTGSGASPIVEKELSPEISGIIISAQGGGSPSVQSEISEAMEALFGLPPHKIKVLTRVE